MRGGHDGVDCRIVGKNASPGDAGHGNWCGASGRSRARPGAVCSAVTRTHRRTTDSRPCAARIGGALAVMMAYRGRAAINRRELALTLVGLGTGTAVGAWGLSLVAPASLTKLFALLILVAVLVSLIGTGVRVSRGALLAGGGAAGVMGTMVGIHGPPIALGFQNAEPAQARAMPGAFFAVGYATSVIALFAVGLFGRQELTVGLLLLPGVGIGYATAPLVGRFVDRRRLRIAILTISGASAIALALR